MSVPSRVISVATAGVMLLAVVGGVFVGMQLGERASEPGTETLAVDLPASAPPRDVALRSAAGFTGFEEGVLGGVVTRTGTTATAEDGVLSVQTSTATMDLRVSAPARLYRIVDAPDALAPGDVVVIRTDGGDTAEAILRVPADLREGDSR